MFRFLLAAALLSTSIAFATDLERTASGATIQQTSNEDQTMLINAASKAYGEQVQCSHFITVQIRGINYAVGGVCQTLKGFDYSLVCVNSVNEEVNMALRLNDKISIEQEIGQLIQNSTCSSGQ